MELNIAHEQAVLLADVKRAMTAQLNQKQEGDSSEEELQANVIREAHERTRLRCEIGGVSESCSSRLSVRADRPEPGLA